MKERFANNNNEIYGYCVKSVHVLNEQSRHKLTKQKSLADEYMSNTHQKKKCSGSETIQFLKEKAEADRAAPTRITIKAK